jgi:hypothetical protein
MRVDQPGEQPGQNAKELPVNTLARKTLGLAAVTALALGAGPLVAATPASAAVSDPSQLNSCGPSQVSSTGAPLPRYRVEAEWFKTIDESGYDWAGSDEPYFIMSSVGVRGTNATKRTSVFGDVDSGERRSLSSADRPVFPLECSGEAPDGIGISVQMWEEDNGDAAEVLAKSAEYFEYAKDISAWGGAPSWVSKALGYMGEACSWASEWQNDDLLGTQTFTVLKTDLSRNLTYVGDYYRFSKFFGDPSSTGYGTPGYHEVRFKVTRIG